MCSIDRMCASTPPDVKQASQLPRATPVPLAGGEDESLSGVDERTTIYLDGLVDGII